MCSYPLFRAFLTLILKVDYKWNICRLLHDGMQDRGMYLSANNSRRVVTFSQSGFTVILIERGPGVHTKQIKTAYSSVAGTAYVLFDNVCFPRLLSMLSDAYYRFVCRSPILWVKLELGCPLYSQILITNAGWSRPLPLQHSAWLLRNASSSSAILLA